MNPTQNKFLGAMFLQGEQDQGNAAWKDRYGALRTDFIEFLRQKQAANPNVFTGDPAKRLFFVESTSYWKKGSGYLKLLADAKEIHNNGTYVEIPAEPNDTNLVNGTGSTSSTRESHFGNDAYERVIAPKLYAKMKETIGQL